MYNTKSLRDNMGVIIIYNIDNYIYKVSTLHFTFCAFLLSGTEPLS